MTERFLSGYSTCHGCVIACGRVVRLSGGANQKGPEYETICAFGPNLLIGDLHAVTRLGDLCDRLGIDTISMGNTLGFALRLFEAGRISTRDTDQIELRWGDSEAVFRLVAMTAARTGIGDLLAQGSRRFGRHFSSEEEAVQVNGLEVAYHDPRALSGMALVYATSPRGGCHNQGDYYMVEFGHSVEEIGIEFMDRFQEPEKGDRLEGLWDEAYVQPQAIGEGVTVIAIKRGQLALESSGPRKEPAIEIARLAVSRVD